MQSQASRKVDHGVLPSRRSWAGPPDRRSRMVSVLPRPTRPSSERLPQTNPLYCLTEPIIARLEQPRLGRPPLLDRRAAVAERALNHLCRQSRAVGFLDGSPIVYPFFSPPPPLPSEAQMIALGWTPAVCQEIPQLAQRAEIAVGATQGLRRLAAHRTHLPP